MNDQAPDEKRPHRTFRRLPQRDGAGDGPDAGRCQHTRGAAVVRGAHLTLGVGKRVVSCSGLLKRSGRHIRVGRCGVDNSPDGRRRFYFR